MLAFTLLTLLSNAPNAPVPGVSDADQVVTAAFASGIDTNPQALKVESNQTTGAQTAVVPALAIVALAAFAFAARKRRAQLGGTGIHVLEAASLGDKRSLVIADVLGDRLVLAVSEAGITVLSSKPAPALEPDPVRLPAATPIPVTVAPPPRPAPSPMGFFARLRGGKPRPTTFEHELRESVEDQELRAKLAAGQRGVVS